MTAPDLLRNYNFGLSSNFQIMFIPGPDRDDRDGTSMLKLSRQGGQGRPVILSKIIPALVTGGHSKILFKDLGKMTEAGISYGKS